jgi:hypothetical protein
MIRWVFVVCVVLMAGCDFWKPGWVRLGHAESSVECRDHLSAVGHAGGLTPMNPGLRRASADGAARTALLRRFDESLAHTNPACRDQVAAAVASSEMTNHWVAPDDTEYALAEISLSALRGECAAALSCSGR